MSEQLLEAARAAGMHDPTDALKLAPLPGSPANERIAALRLAMPGLFKGAAPIAGGKHAREMTREEFTAAKREAERNGNAALERESGARFLAATQRKFSP